MVSTVTLTPANGFNSVVALSSGSNATGMTGTFSPSSITGSGTSNLTISVPAGTAVGTYPFNLSGTGGGLTASPSVTVNVTAATLPFSVTQPSGN